MRPSGVSQGMVQIVETPTELATPPCSRGFWAGLPGSTPRLRRSPDFPVRFSGPCPAHVLPPLREAERRNGADNNRGTCAKAPRLPVRGAGAPSGAPPRRLWARGPSSRRTRCFHLLSRRLSPPFIQPVQPRRGDPRSRADGDPGASRGHAYEARPQDAAPRSVSRTSPEDALR